MNTRLKVICILFAVSYLLVIGHAIFSELLPSAISGFKEGYNSAKEKKEGVDNPKKKEYTELHLFCLQPVDGAYTFPSSLVNLKTGEPIKAEFRELLVKMPIIKDIPAWVHIFKPIKMILSFCLVGIMFFIPMLSFIVIRSIVKNEIFDSRNIIRIRRIGYLILTAFSITLSFLYIERLVSSYIINIEGYQVVAIKDLTLLIIGLLVLLFAEILRIAVKMKEENDLTV